MCLHCRGKWEGVGDYIHVKEIVIILSDAVRFNLCQRGFLVELSLLFYPPSSIQFLICGYEPYRAKQNIPPRLFEYLPLATRLRTCS